MTDVDVDYISLVNKGANKQKIQIYKADEKPETSKNEGIEEVAGFFNVIKSFFTQPEKNDEEMAVKSFNARMAERDVMDNIWRTNDALASTMMDILNSKDIKDKKAALNTVINQHSEYLKNKVAGIEDVKKAEEFFNQKGGNEDMKKEELQEVIKEAINPLNEKIEALEKELNPEVEEKEEIKKEENIENITKEDIARTVKEAIEPLNERIKKIENFKGISKQLDGEEEQIEKSTSIFAGIDI